MIKLFREVTTDQPHPEIPDYASKGTTLDWSNDMIVPHQQRPC